MFFKVIDFDMVHNECRGDPIQKTVKEYKTLTSHDLKEYPEREKSIVVQAVNCTKRNDLQIERHTAIEK